MEYNLVSPVYAPEGSLEIVGVDITRNGDGVISVVFHDRGSVKNDLTLRVSNGIFEAFAVQAVNFIRAEAVKSTQEKKA